MKCVTIGYALEPIPCFPFVSPELKIPVSVGVGIGPVGWSKDIAEVEINVNPA